MSVELPIPVSCHRLVGLEIELDALGARRHEFALPHCWTQIGDGSLRNGYEYILTTPIAAQDLLPYVQEFSLATHGKVYAAKTGAYHVHISAHDYTAGDVARLCRVYHHFQPIIDLLVAASRRSAAHNQYCMPLPAGESFGIDWARSFYQLDSTVATRSEAKGSRPRCVINACMLRCSSPALRSIEFRQQSVSTNATVIYGWALLCAGLVEFCRSSRNTSPFLASRPTLARFLVMLRRIGRIGSVKGLAEWARWRIDYLTVIPKNLDESAALLKMANRPCGLFTVARALGSNNAVALAWLQSQIEKGAVSHSGHRYQAHRSALAAADLDVMRRLWQTDVSVENQPVEAQARPATDAALVDGAVAQLQISQDGRHSVSNSPAQSVV